MTMRAMILAVCFLGLSSGTALATAYGGGDSSFLKNQTRREPRKPRTA
jgi:hypothetical protein